MRDAHAVFEDALALPEDERADLARRLSESLESEVHDDAEDRWAQTVARRVHELRNGTAATVSVDEAFGSAWQRLADRRGA